jgi:uncharacterized membrane protein YbhN (UPF0104 family)
MSRRRWTLVSRVAAAVTLAAVVWRVGAGPFWDGFRSVDAASLAAAAAIGALSTVCCAWRWSVVARGHGLDLPLPAAVAGYYRSVFLNVTLPGGVVGDVHRGLSHGRSAGEMGRALRAVAWERGLGQVVQVVLTVTILLVLPSPVRSSMPPVAIALALAAVAAVAVGWSRRSLIPTGALPAVAVASAVVVLANAAMFLIAARTAGVSASSTRMLPLALLAMAAMVLPSIAGWGPREGATAWVFGAAGLGAADGVATAVVYGVMVLVSALPGALVLVWAWRPRTGVWWRAADA